MGTTRHASRTSAPEDIGSRQFAVASSTNLDHAFDVPIHRRQGTDIDA
ncbi:hypothetical protein [Paludibacterium denitrificans]|nr:hypothetical protein [Paludibacterium denitrificans]